MLLSDVDIRGLLPELKIECDNPQKPFDADGQVQPASIDLRLSNVFWEPRRSRRIDLLSRRDELAPRRDWRRKVLREGESLVLKPRQLILGRIYEKLTIPQQHAGRIEGRSSFARMGLGVHCTGDFLNPGYRGHMPLQLYNYSPNEIEIYPYLEICQLFLMKLSHIPSRGYGVQELQSKYMDDDGGPSYWWRDVRIIRLAEELRRVNVPKEAQERILSLIGPQEVEIVDRFEKFLRNLPASEVRNAADVLSAFTDSEAQASRRYRILRGVSRGAFPLLAATGLGMGAAPPYGFLHYLIWAGAIVSAFPAYRAYLAEEKAFLMSVDVVP